MHSKPLPSQSELVGRFSYDPLTGHVTHAKPGALNGRRAGSEHFRKDGSKRNRVLLGFCEHRVIWQMVHGSIPDGMVIDHIDGDPFNNRLANLRCVTDRQNGLNRKVHKNSSTGFPGVYKTKGGRFRARAVVNGRVVGLGTYETIEQAIAARKEATDAHGELVRPIAPRPVAPEREAQRCPTCGHLPRVLSPEQIQAGRERAHRQWLRRKELIAAALGKTPSLDSTRVGCTL